MLVSTSASQVPAEERQVNLLLALRHTSTGMSATEVITRVYGYDPDGADRSRRMFERDKDVLRSIGVPVVVTGQGTEARYRVDEDDYVLPPLRLEAADVAALELAASAWREGSLPVAARHALTKLLAVAKPRSKAQVVPDLSVDLSGQDVPAVLPTAVEERRLVAFDYLSARSGTVRRRLVEPYRLRLSEGAWYLDARDTTLPSSPPGPATDDSAGTAGSAGNKADDALRSFRLARVRGPVEVVSAPGAFTVPTVLGDAPAATGTAVLALAPGRALALRARAREVLTAPARRPPQGWDVLALDYEEPMVLAGALAALADAVVVLEPEPLRQAVLEHLRGAAALAGTADEEI